MTRRNRVKIFANNSNVVSGETPVLFFLVMASERSVTRSHLSVILLLVLPLGCNAFIPRWQTGANGMRGQDFGTHQRLAR